MKTATRQMSNVQKTATGFAASLLLIGAAIFATAGNTAHAAGFETIDPPQNTSVSDKVEVLEFL